MREDDIPLVVDLDGTLITHDSLITQLIIASRSAPRQAMHFARRFRTSRGQAKQRLWANVGVDPARLHYSKTFVAFLEAQALRGRQLILATGATQGLAEAVAEYLGVFQGAVGSDGDTNLTGRRKATLLVSQHGPRGFDYAGNSIADVPVWASARCGITCNAPSRVRTHARRVTVITHEFDDRRYRGPSIQWGLALRQRTGRDTAP